MITAKAIVLVATLVCHTSANIPPTDKPSVEGYSINKKTFAESLSASGRVRYTIPKDVDYDKLVIKFNSPRPVLSEYLLSGVDVHEIVLADNHLYEIRPFSFSGVAHLERIDLGKNELEEIEVGVFNGLDLMKLDLSHNNIRKIDSKALDDLPKLVMIDLSHNQITAWDPEWFRDSPDLTRVYINHNQIKVLPAAAFHNFEGDKRLREASFRLTLDFSSNHIEDLQPEVFDGISRIYDLWLNNNIIKNIDKALLQGVTVDSLRLNDNRIECLEDEELAVTLRVKLMELEGNPWDCTCLGKVIAWVDEHQAKVPLNFSKMQCDLEGLDRKLTALENKLE